MKADIAHFVVAGEFITDTARRLWNEELEPEKAMNILECLRSDEGGITKDQMMAVLEGRMKLVGDSDKGIGMEPDTYKGLTLKQVMGKLRKRAVDAEEDLADAVQIALGDTVTVGSPTGARRVPSRRTERDTLGRKVLKSDVDFDDLIDDPERVRPKNGRKPTKTLRMYKRDDDLGKRMASTSPSAEEEAEKKLEARAKKQRKEAREKVDASASNRITGDTGWLSPEGRFYPCPGYAQHGYVMWALGHTENPSNHFVEMEGWIRMGLNGKEQNFFASSYERKNFTAKQEERIKDYCEQTGQKLPFWLREKDED